jgi:hypothetical protein
VKPLSGVCCRSWGHFPGTIMGWCVRWVATWTALSDPIMTGVKQACRMLLLALRLD